MTLAIIPVSPMASAAVVIVHSLVVCDYYMIHSMLSHGRIKHLHRSNGE